MDDGERTTSKIENIRQYLRKKFAGKNISEAKQCALIDDEICFGYLITIEDGGASHSVLPVNEFLETTAGHEINQILEERNLEHTLKKAGKEIVRLKSNGFDIWKPLKCRRTAS